MPQQTEARILAGGIDADNAPYAIENGSLLNSVNLRALRKAGQTAGELSYIEGNTLITSVSALIPSGTVTQLGKCVDAATSCIYLLIGNTVNTIIEYNVASGTARMVIDDTMITGGLGWTSDMFICCEAGDGELFFADGVHDLRYIDLTTTYSTGQPITQNQLSFVAEPGAVPPTETRTAVVGGQSLIQYTALQFTYRIVLTGGFQSVLSAYSLSSLPARQSAVAANADSGNAVTITIPVTQPIPANWAKVELIARFVETNAFYVIKRWDKSNPADATAVNNHNSGTPLTLADWLGDTLETVDPVNAAKLFDATPIAPKRLLRAANRLLIANFKEGYNTPTQVPNITVANTTFLAIPFALGSPSPGMPTYDTFTPYAIVVEQDGPAREWWFAIILRFNGKNYLLPQEASTGKFYYDNNTIPALTSGNFPVNDGIFNLPQYVSRESLFELKEIGDPDFATIQTSSNPVNIIRKNIVKEANALSVLVDDTTGAGSIFCFPFKGIGGASITVNVESGTPEDGGGGKNRAFLPGAIYSRGIQYYDGAGRRSGVLPLPAITFPFYDSTAPGFTQKVTFTLPGSTTAIPDWAEYFSLTLSRPSKAQRFGFLFGGIVKAMFKNSDGSIVYGNPSELASPPTGRTVYGIGVPISATFNYEYAKGDYVMYSHASGHGRADIIGTVNGHIVLQYTNFTGMENLCDGFSKRVHVDYNTSPVSGDMYLTDSTFRQGKTAFIVFGGVQSTDSQYEIAAFGNITGPAGNKQFGNFYATGTKSIAVFGDTYTQQRTSASGGGTGLSMSPYDSQNSSFWVNDLGRPAPVDSVGQKNLTNTIRFSNARIPGASINGYASFDANDYKTVDISAGPITSLALTTRGVQDGGQLLALCEHGSFAALIGQQQIAGADGKNAFTATVNVLGDFNVIKGGWGCLSPRSVIAFEGHVWWVDAYNWKVIEFNESGAGPVSDFRASRLWNELLEAVAPTDYDLITASVNPTTKELMVSLPQLAISKPDLATVIGLRNPLDAVDGTVRTWLYNWEANRWVGGYSSGAEFAHVGNRVFGWMNGLWEEFNNTPGNYYGGNRAALAVVPFSSPQFVKTPLSLQLTINKTPDITWVAAGMNNDAVTNIQPYKSREGIEVATILRNRKSGGANTPTAYQVQSINGPRLKNKTISAVLIWQPTSEPIALSAATLVFDISSGH